MTGAVAVVTGTGSGIGRAVALRLAGSDTRVVAADIDLDGAETTAGKNSELITARRVDVADPDSVEELCSWVAGSVDTPRVLVNAAGWDRTSPFLESTPEFVRHVVDVNYLGPVHVCRPFLPAMAEAGAAGRWSISPATRAGSAARGRRSTLARRAA
jgi:2-hydroxycyclohexanecarboxyl-CoA dehydrogenase